MANILQQLYPFAALWGQYEMGRKKMGLEKERIRSQEETAGMQEAGLNTRARDLNKTNLQMSDNEFFSDVAGKIIDSIDNGDYNRALVLAEEVEHYAGPAQLEVVKFNIQEKLEPLAQRIVRFKTDEAIRQETGMAAIPPSPSETMLAQAQGAPYGIKIPDFAANVESTPEFTKAVQLYQWGQMLPVGDPRKATLDALIQKRTRGTGSFKTAGMGELQRYLTEAQMLFPDATPFQTNPLAVPTSGTKTEPYAVPPLNRPKLPKLDLNPLLDMLGASPAAARNPRLMEALSGIARPR